MRIISGTVSGVSRLAGLQFELSKKARQRRLKRPYAIRKSKEYLANRPGDMERTQRTHTEEFYEVTEASFEIGELNRALLEWEKVYNTIRPHQALGYLTPQEFLKQYQQKRREDVSLII